jgi:hypothetical protein
MNRLISQTEAINTKNKLKSNVNLSTQNEKRKIKPLVYITTSDFTR